MKKFKAITFSFDDGVKQDVKLIDIFNRNGLKGTFNLNSGIPRFPKEELKAIYAGHEVACHGEFHLSCDQIPRDVLTREVWRDREVFEEISAKLQSWDFVDALRRVAEKYPEYSKKYHLSDTIAIAEAQLEDSIYQQRYPISEGDERNES